MEVVWTGLWRFAVGRAMLEKAHQAEETARADVTRCDDKQPGDDGVETDGEERG